MNIERVGGSEALLPGRWWVLALVMLSTFISTLDFTIVNLALEAISQALGASLGVVEWVVLSYALAMSGLLLGVGRLADIYGSRRLFIAGLAIFTLGSGLCVTAPTIGTLIAARVVQAGGGALLQALGVGLVTAAFPSRERGRALGLVLMAASLGSITGPGIGGLLIASFGWESLFAVNVPIGIAAMLLAWRVLPADRAPGQARFDLPGMLLFLPAAAGLLLALTQAPYQGPSPAVIGLAFASLALLVAFFWWERRAPAPLLDLGLFRNRTFSLMLLLLLIGPLNYGLQLLVLPFALRGILSLDTIQVGLLILCMPLGYGVTTLISGWLSDWLNPRLLMVVGLCFAAGGVLLLTPINANWQGGDVVWRLMLIGVGQGLYQTPNQNLLLSSVPRERLGVVGGLLGTVRQLSLSLGTALGGALWAAGRLGAAAQRGVAPDSAPAQVAGFRLAELTLAAVVAAAVILALLAPLKQREPQPARADAASLP